MTCTDPTAIRICITNYTHEPNSFLFWFWHTQAPPLNTHAQAHTPTHTQPHTYEPTHTSPTHGSSQRHARKGKSPYPHIWTQGEGGYERGRASEIARTGDGLWWIAARREYGSLRLAYIRTRQCYDQPQPWNRTAKSFGTLCLFSIWSKIGWYNMFNFTVFFSAKWLIWETISRHGAVGSRVGLIIQRSSVRSRLAAGVSCQEQVRSPWSFQSKCRSLSFASRCNLMRMGCSGKNFGHICLWFDTSTHTHYRSPAQVWQTQTQHTALSLPLSPSFTSFLSFYIQTFHTYSTHYTHV